MRILTTITLTIGVLTSAASAMGPDTYPGDEWTILESPADAGWSKEKLDAAGAFGEKAGTAALTVVQGGVIVYEWGHADREYMCHSMRKSILCGLYGIYVDNDTIDLSKTLADLGIDDKPPVLTDAEKQATIKDLLKARSGIFHGAAYSPQGMIDGLPERGSHAPGTYWYYNNWDFNTLGTIFTQETGLDIYDAFEKHFVGPLAMQDFNMKKQRYVYDDVSIHPAYTFRLSGRDLARFGLLYARMGRWGDEQIISPEWIKESTTSYSKTNRGGYGYMWWTTAPGDDKLMGAQTEVGAYTASGSGGHYLLVMPKADIVIAHRVNTSTGTARVGQSDFATLVTMILAARPDAE